jgi:hypothetical protein
MHKCYCFAGQPAACEGYFARDVVPCVCGRDHNLLFVLSQVALHSVPVKATEPSATILPLSA